MRIYGLTKQFNRGKAYREMKMNGFSTNGLSVIIYLQDVGDGQHQNIQFSASELDKLKLWIEEVALQKKENISNNKSVL